MGCKCLAPQYCGYCRPVLCAPIRNCNSTVGGVSFSGSVGTVGPKGDRGPQGFQGIQGPVGPPGATAASYAWRNNNDGTWDLLIDGVPASGGPLSFPYNP